MSATDSQIALKYAVSVPTVRRWRASGRRAKIPVPFHQPHEMEAWWDSMAAAGHFTKPCPQSITEAAENAAGSAGGASPASSASLANDPGLLAALASIEANGDGFDYSSGVHIAKRNLQVTDSLLQRALKAEDVKAIGPLQRRLNEASDNYRALMRDQARIRADAGETLPKTEVRAALMEIHGNIQRQFRQRLRHSYDLAPDHLKTREKWNVFCEELVDQVCVALTTTKFAAPES